MRRSANTINSCMTCTSAAAADCLASLPLHIYYTNVNADLPCTRQARFTGGIPAHPPSPAPRVRVTMLWMMMIVVVFGGRTAAARNSADANGKAAVAAQLRRLHRAAATRIREPTRGDHERIVMAASQCARAGGVGRVQRTGDSQCSMPSNTHSSIDRVITATSTVIVIFAVSARHAAWRRRRRRTVTSSANCIRARTTDCSRSRGTAGMQRREDNERHLTTSDTCLSLFSRRPIGRCTQPFEHLQIRGRCAANRSGVDICSTDWLVVNCFAVQQTISRSGENNSTSFRLAYTEVVIRESERALLFELSQDAISARDEIILLQSNEGNWQIKTGN